MVAFILAERYARRSEIYIRNIIIGLPAYNPLLSNRKAKDAAGGKEKAER
jgi:hypothetical protein